MARPDQIPTDLTLEIGDDVGPEQFLALTRAFFGYVNEVTQMTSLKGSTSLWKIEVREGSALIGLRPTENVAPEVVRLVYGKVSKAAQAIADGDIEGAALSEAATKHLKALSDVTEGTRGKPLSVRLWVERRPLQVNADMARVIRDDWRTSYSDFGTIEGRLRTIQDAGSLTFEAKDELLGQSVKCFFPENMLTTVFDNFRKRVEISGLIHYRRNGTPVSIEASKVEPVPSDDDLPSVSDVRGILRVVG